MLSFLNRLQPFALLVLRVGLGLLLMAHGWGKVFGGFQQHKAFVMQIGMPGWTAYLSAGTEFIGGFLLIIGLITRVAALFVVGEMFFAILKIHWGASLAGLGTGSGWAVSRFLLAQNGLQLPLIFALMALTLLFFGGGPIAVDHLLARRKPPGARK